MSAPVVVTGGAGGITANAEDLWLVAGALRTASLVLGEALGEVRAPFVRAATDVGAEHDLMGSFTLSDDLDHACLVLRAGRERADDLADRTVRAAHAYGQVERGVADDIGGVLAGLAAGLGDGVSLRPAAGAQELFASLTSATDVLARETSLAAGWAGHLDPDGHAVVHDTGPDLRRAAVTGPRSLDELITGLALRNQGRHGEVSVSFVVGADGVRRAIVDVPGTKSWNPLPNHDVTSVGTDVRAMAGLRTSYENGVLEAMHDAGVARDEPVLIVGHSEGGIVAVNAARDALRDGRFRVTHVVTAGSPIGRLAHRVPSSVQVLALENRDDLVPSTDGADNRDRRNVTTVTGEQQHLSVTGNHDLDTTYRPIAVAAEHACAPSVDAFLAGADGFLAGGAMHTHTYVITRRF